MATEVETKDRAQSGLPHDFAARLEPALARADRERHRRLLANRLRAALPAVLMVGPIVGWRLILVSPDGVHVGVSTLAWITAILDVGVHLDTSLLSYLGLQALPAFVGFVLFVLVTVTLLGSSKEEQ
jgi:hypothetical protein